MARLPALAQRSAFSLLSQATRRGAPPCARPVSACALRFPLHLPQARRAVLPPAHLPAQSPHFLISLELAPASAWTALLGSSERRSLCPAAPCSLHAGARPARPPPHARPWFLARPAVSPCKLRLPARLLQLGHGRRSQVPFPQPAFLRAKFLWLRPPFLFQLAQVCCSSPMVVGRCGAASWCRDPRRDLLYRAELRSAVDACRLFDTLRG
ncbi:uncharacterized protein [Zea mays]|jgi:hypothetical protein|uniref:uncharacterized protein n=1 Tax=Zea mays TaxID=4577 RepID=UPI000220EF83|nr:uncharacterized protein LOC109945622 [Zea mays]|eukprot:XP_020407527.1 uncharacterized protein LOC109945622 [Zea mays]